MHDGDSPGAGARRRPGFLGWLAKRLLISMVCMVVLSLAGIGYLAHRDRTLLEEAVRGLDAVAEKLERDDRDSAARGLRELGSKLERLDERSGPYSEKVKQALARIRRRSEDLYQEAHRAISGEGEDEGPSTPGPDAPAE